MFGGLQGMLSGEGRLGVVLLIRGNRDIVTMTRAGHSVKMTYS